MMAISSFIKVHFVLRHTVFHIVLFAFKWKVLGVEQHTQKVRKKQFHNILQL